MCILVLLSCNDNSNQSKQVNSNFATNAKNDSIAIPIDDAPRSSDSIFLPESLGKPAKIIFAYPRIGGGGGSSRRACPSGIRDAAGRCIDTMEPQLPDPTEGPDAGNPNPEGTCSIPPGGGLENVATPTTVIGTGTPTSCTSAAVVSGIAQGGIIVFDCGPDPITITLTETARIFNNSGPEIVIDGGGLVTLSGNNERRILYMNTCDFDLGQTTPNCDNQDHPRLTLQNLTLIGGNSSSDVEHLGGGAVFARGGRIKVVNSRFFGNECASTGPDLGGAALRVLSQFNDLPVFVTESTFGGADGFGNHCSNGGAISSIGVSWTITNSLFSFNSAVGAGGNPPQPGTQGGGNGGAIYNDGTLMALNICGTRIEQNHANEFGGSIFFVSNDNTGNIHIDQSVITNNGSPNISQFGGTFSASNSTID